jgi:hypothetical protein
MAGFMASYQGFFEQAAQFSRLLVGAVRRVIQEGSIAVS